MHPILFSLGKTSFYISPAFAGLGALLGYYYFKSQKQALGLSTEDFWNLVLGLCLGCFLGGMLLAMILSGRGLLANAQNALLYRRLPGGAYYGGFWGAILSAYLYTRLKPQLDFQRLADVLGATAPLGLALLRVGCLLNGCCYGRPTRAAWGIVFTDPRSSVPQAWLGVPLYPTQVYESLGSLAIFLFVHFHCLRRVRSGHLKPGTAFTASVVLYAIMRFELDFIRGTPQPSAAGLTATQWIAALSALGSIFWQRRWSAR